MFGPRLHNCYCYCLWFIFIFIVDSGRFYATRFLTWKNLMCSNIKWRQNSGSSMQCLICFIDLQPWKYEAKMLSKHLVTLLFSVLTIFVSCHDDCFPKTFCNTTFSDPTSLKTMSNNIVHIGVSLRIIDKNNVRENATKPEFNEGFKVRKCFALFERS